MSEASEETLALTARVDELYASVDILFVFLAGVICFLMQAGFGKIGPTSSENELCF